MAVFPIGLNVNSKAVRGPMYRRRLPFEDVLKRDN